MEQLNDLDFETIENAVMETARGRWFLSEYKKRHAGSGTPEILNAIAKLEKVVREIGHATESAKPEKPQTAEKRADSVKAAPIATNGADEKSKKPRASAANSKTVLAPLQPEPEPLSKDNLQFFANDEDLFADAVPASVPPAHDHDETETGAPKTAVTTSFAPMQAKPEKPAGERFKVFRTSSADTDRISKEVEQNDDVAKPQTAVREEEKPAQIEATAQQVPDPAMTATQDEKDRIVVIRNASASDIEIPLAGDSVLSQSKPADS